MSSTTSTKPQKNRAKLRLKPLDPQTIVITGASSGIGLVTARLAAKRGARLVLAARNKDALMQLTEEIRRQGGEADHIQANVGHEEEMEAIARLAQDRFGGFDSGINNAASQPLDDCMVARFANGGGRCQPVPSAFRISFPFLLKKQLTI